VLVTQGVVPRLKGLPVAFARKLLKAANCALGKVTRKTATKRRLVGKVLSQKRKAGTTLPKGTRVGVTVGRR
jgi:beta-lactam-binding protein with PASTA domain